MKMKTEIYSRTDSGKSWKSQPDSVETEEIDDRQHDLLGDKKTMSWFRRLGGSETATYGYFSTGYKLARLVSCNPDRTTKKVRTFTEGGK